MPEAGAVFGIVWLASVVPASVVALVLFYQRRSVQPIKARYPALVRPLRTPLGHLSASTQRSWSRLHCAPASLKRVRASDLT
jgi:hypothetical protein